MDIDKLLKEYGFEPSSSGGGCMWYTKGTTYKGKRIEDAMHKAQDAF